MSVYRYLAIVSDRFEIRLYEPPFDNIFLETLGQSRIQAYRTSEADTDIFDPIYSHYLIYDLLFSEYPVAGFRLAPLTFLNQNGKLYLETLYHFSDTFNHRFPASAEISRLFTAESYRKSGIFALLWYVLGKCTAEYTFLLGTAGFGKNGHLFLHRIEKELFHPDFNRFSVPRFPLPGSIPESISDFSYPFPQPLGFYLKAGAKLLTVGIDPLSNSEPEGLLIWEQRNGYESVLKTFLHRHRRSAAAESFL